MKNSIAKTGLMAICLATSLSPVVLSSAEGKSPENSEIFRSDHSRVSTEIFELEEFLREGWKVMNPRDVNPRATNARFEFKGRNIFIYTSSKDVGEILKSEILNSKIKKLEGVDVSYVFTPRNPNGIVEANKLLEIRNKRAILFTQTHIPGYPDRSLQLKRINVVEWDNSTGPPIGWRRCRYFLKNFQTYKKEVISEYNLSTGEVVPRRKIEAKFPFIPSCNYGGKFNYGRVGEEPSCSYHGTLSALKAWKKKDIEKKRLER